jgi:hypothetical protein
MKRLERFLLALAAIVCTGLFLVGCPPQGGGSSASNDASLRDLRVVWVGLGPLAFGFAPGTADYTLDIPNSLDNVTVTPVANSSGTTIKINGTSVSSGESFAVALNLGPNMITAEVTAEDGATLNTYVVNATRAAPDSTNARLAGLLLSQGSLQPVFSENTLSYSASVGLSVNTVTVTPFVSDSNATVKVNGNPAAHAVSYGPISLNPGNNLITVLVTAADFIDAKSYSITINKAASTNANLSSLVPSVGALSPGFSSATTSYSMNVGNSVSSIQFTATAADASATIKVNGNAVSSGQPSGSISLDVGVNTVNVVVTAEDAATTRTYTVMVTRAAPSTNANLSSLVPSVGALSPGFNSATTSYSINVGNSVSSIQFTATAADASATIEVNGTSLPSGQQSGPITLIVGANAVNVRVTAQDGTTTKTYSVTVNRAEMPSISGSVSRIGTETIGPASSLMVWWRKVNSGAHGMSTYTTGSFPRTFSLPGMENGEYYVGAFLDKDNSGDSSPGDLFGQCSNLITVNGANVTGVPITVQSRSEGALQVWLGNVPAEYNLLHIYFVVLSPNEDLLGGSWEGYGYGTIIGGTCSAQGIDVSSGSLTFAGGSCIVNFFIYYADLPYPPSVEDLHQYPPYSGVLYGEKLTMVDGAALVGFDFGDLQGYQP